MNTKRLSNHPFQNPPLTLSSSDSQLLPLMISCSNSLNFSYNPKPTFLSHSHLNGQPFQASPLLLQPWPSELLGNLQLNHPLPINHPPPLRPLHQRPIVLTHMHRPRPIRRLEVEMIQILSFERRVAAADEGLAEVPEAVVYVVVVCVVCVVVVVVLVVSAG